MPTPFDFPCSAPGAILSGTRVGGGLKRLLIPAESPIDRNSLKTISARGERSRTPSARVFTARTRVKWRRPRGWQKVAARNRVGQTSLKLRNTASGGPWPSKVVAGENLLAIRTVNRRLAQLRVKGMQFHPLCLWVFSLIKFDVMKFEVQGYTNTGGAFCEISEARFDDIKSSKEICLFALELEEKFALLLDNFYEFEIELLKLAEASLIWPVSDHGSSMNDRLKLDRRLVNLLTSCRLYLDQTDHGISTLFGNNSAELTSIKAFKSQLYDNHWGYRFLEALRNHVQHSGLPVHIINYNSARVSEGEDYFKITVIPQSLVSELAENSSFKSSVLTELRNQGEKKIDLRSPTREYVTCFGKVHDQIRKIIESRLSAGRAQFESALTEYSSIDGEKVMHPCVVKQNEDGTTAERVALFSDFLNHLDSLRKKNKTNRDFTRWFASNNDQRKG
jgi:hypothetical protein